MIARVVGASLLAGAALLPACAPGPGRIGPEVSSTPGLLEGQAGGYDVLPLTRTVGVQSTLIRAPVARAWAALPGVYAELGLKITSVDTTALIVGSLGRALRRVAGRSPATWFDCPGAYENLASSGDVTVGMRTQVVAQGDELTDVRTQVSAAARGTVSTQDVPCRGNGALEKLLVERLTAALQASAPKMMP